MVSTRGVKLDTPTNFRPRKKADTEADNGEITATELDVTRKSRRERSKPMKLRGAAKNEAADEALVPNKTAKRKAEPKTSVAASKRSVGGKRKRGANVITPKVEEVTEEERKPKRIKISLKNAKKESAASKEAKTAIKRGEEKTSAATPGKEVLVKFRLDSKITSETRSAVLHFPLLSCRTEDAITVPNQNANVAKKSVVAKQALSKDSSDREVKVKIRLGTKLQKQTCVAAIPYISNEKEINVAIKFDSKVQSKKCIATLPHGIINAISSKPKNSIMSEKATIFNMSTQTKSEPSVDIRAEKSAPAIAHVPTNEESAVKLTTPSRNRCKFPNCNRYRQSHTGGFCLTHKPPGIPQASPDADAVLAAISTATVNEAKESTNAAPVKGVKRHPKQQRITPDSHRCKYEGCTKYRQGYTGGYCLTHKMFGTGRARPEYDELPPLPGVSLAQDALPPLLSNETVGNSHNTRQKIKSPMNKDTSVSSPENNTDVANSKKRVRNRLESSKCSVEGCNRYKRSRNGGYCLTHKHLWDGIVEPEEIKIAPQKQQCRFEGCVKYKRSHTGGYCLSHKHLWDGREDDSYFSPLSRVGADCSIPPLPDVELPDMDDLMNEVTGMRPDNASPLLMHEKTDDNLAPLPAADTFVDFSLEPLQSAKTSIANEGNGSFKTNSTQQPASVDVLPAFSSELEEAKSLTTDNQDEKRDPTEYKLKTEPCAKIDAQEHVENNNTSADHLENSAPTTHHSPGKPSSLETSLVLPPGIEIRHSSECRDSSMRSLCKVVGCKKLEQTGNEGFCRSHYNLIYARNADLQINRAEPWICLCGKQVSGKQKRCGKCFRWKGGAREAYSFTGASKNKVSTKRETTEIKAITTASGKEILEEYWTCSGCGNQVYEHKSRCGLCHHWRGGKREGGWTLGAKQGTHPSTDWECCGEVIPAKKTRCGKCRGKLRHGAVFGSTSFSSLYFPYQTSLGWRGGKRQTRWSYDSGHGANGRAEDEGENIDNSVDWTCQKCNNINLGKKKRCKKCCSWRFTRKMNARVSVPSTSSFDDNEDDDDDEEENGHWICKACSYDNFGSEFKCLMCDQNRPNWKKYVPNGVPSNDSISETLSGSTIPTSLVAANNATAVSRKECDAINIDNTELPESNSTAEVKEQMASPPSGNNDSPTEPEVSNNIKSTKEEHLGDECDQNGSVALENNPLLSSTLNPNYLDNIESKDYLASHSSYDYGSSYLHSDFLGVTAPADLDNNIDEQPPECEAVSCTEESKVANNIVHV